MTIVCKNCLRWCLSCRDRERFYCHQSGPARAQDGGAGWPTKPDSGVCRISAQGLELLTTKQSERVF